MWPRTRPGPGRGWGPLRGVLPEAVEREEEASQVGTRGRVEEEGEGAASQTGGDGKDEPDAASSRGAGQLNLNLF